MPNIRECSKAQQERELLDLDEIQRYIRVAPAWQVEAKAQEMLDAIRRAIAITAQDYEECGDGFSEDIRNAFQNGTRVALYDVELALNVDIEKPLRAKREAYLKRLTDGVS